jgi:hemolysin activation/secretion protein
MMTEPARICPRRLRGLLLALVLFPLCSIAFAQYAPGQSPGDRDLIRERQQRQLDEQRQRLDELQKLPGQQRPVAPAVPGEEEHCVNIQRIHIKGGDRIPEARQSEIVAPFEGRCLNKQHLNDLLKAITRFYLDRGYITARAYLPEQDLSEGKLEVLVVEGRLEGLERGESGPSAREMAMTFPGKVGDYLNLREIEQMVDQLGRLPSRQAQIDILPGEATGGSRIQVKGQPEKPWRISLTRDNSGEKSTGEHQWSTAFSWDSPLGLADQLYLRGGSDTTRDHWRHSENQSLHYNLPYGWWTFSYSYSQSDYRTSLKHPAIPDLSFSQDGKSKTHQLRINRLLHRDDVSKTGVSLGLARLSSRNYFDDILLDSSSELTEAQLGFNHGRRIGKSFVNVDLGWQRGIGALGAQSSGHPHGSEPVARYNKYSFTLSYLQPFVLWGESFSVESFVNGQHSDDVLFSPQRISLGGLASVRGFKEQTLMGDSGGYARNQIRWRHPLTWEPLHNFVHEINVVLAYDIGAIAGNKYNGNAHGRMSGNAIEISAQGRYLAASVTFAQSLEHPDAIRRGEHPVYFSFSLNY